MSTTTRPTRIPAVRLVPEPLDRAAPAEAAHQLGGEPDFLDEDEIPRCPECQDRMALYARLGSVNEWIRLPALGSLLVFLCLECGETASFLHCD